MLQRSKYKPINLEDFLHLNLCKFCIDSENFLQIYGKYVSLKTRVSNV